MISRLHAYPQTHYVVYVKQVSFVHVNYTAVKCFLGKKKKRGISTLWVKGPCSLFLLPSLGLHLAFTWPEPSISLVPPSASQLSCPLGARSLPYAVCFSCLLSEPACTCLPTTLSLRHTPQAGSGLALCIRLVQVLDLLPGKEKVEGAAKSVCSSDTFNGLKILCGGQWDK